MKRRNGLKMVATAGGGGWEEGGNRGRPIGRVGEWVGEGGTKGSRKRGWGGWVEIRREEGG